MQSPLQNRVTPFGDIIAVYDRGIYLGNRGIIHDPATKTLLNRRWSSKAWIICVCEWRGRKREPMAQRSWTELFFLDEATAFAAGHRPCFYCRRPAAEAFRTAFSRDQLSAPELDSLLDAERLEGRKKRLHPLRASWRNLPNGAMVARGDDAFLIYGGQALPWSSAGYGAPVALDGEVRLITPPSAARAFRRSYSPVLHPSAMEILQ